MRRLVHTRAAPHGQAAQRENAARLVFTVGRDAALLRQEMDKLCAYLGERKEIAAEDIDQICTRSTECTVFQMVDAQVAGNNDTAFALLGDMLRSGEDRVGILAMLLRQYRILYHMRCLMDERTPQASQAQLLGIPPLRWGARSSRRAALTRRGCARPMIFCWTMNTESSRAALRRRAAPKARFCTWRAF